MGEGSKPEETHRAPSPFYAFRGLGKKVFRELKGGEAILRREREGFYGAIEASSPEPRVR